MKNESVTPDFTEARYKEILENAKQRFEFVSFGQTSNNPHVLWRHDVDFSVHRAFALAKIEHLMQVKSTYFFHPNSEFYNMQTRTIVELIKQIKQLGHDIGLHFDPEFYGSSIATKAQLLLEITRAKQAFSWITGITPVAVSFHNYGHFKEHMPTDESIDEMVNAYSQKIQDSYFYVSDSNGIWRFHDLNEIVKRDDLKSLQVLTHPEWWQTETMPPRDRISRCIDGRARWLEQGYDAALIRYDRPNIRSFA